MKDSSQTSLGSVAPQRGQKTWRARRWRGRSTTRLQRVHARQTISLRPAARADISRGGAEGRRQATSSRKTVTTRRPTNGVAQDVWRTTIGLFARALERSGVRAAYAPAGRESLSASSM